MARNLRHRALGELRHRAVGAGFRRGTLRGAHPSELRARALRRRWKPDATDMAIGLAAIGAGFLLGRWWARRHRDSIPPWSSSVTP